MKSKLNYSEDGYREHVEKSISFVGLGVDFFTQAKARHLLRVAKRHLGNLSDVVALDVGCGVGLTDHLLSDSLGTLHGADLDERAIESASKANPSAHYHTYDGETLPFPDDTFDLVFAINVMHHVPPKNWDSFTLEMRRVVKTGGLVMVFEHNPINPLTQLAVFRCSFDGDAVLLSSRTIEHIFVRSGMTLVEKNYILFFPLRSKVFGKAEEHLGWLPLGAQYYVAATK
ncbi:MAG: class I SAM-dependent methyltransferase [Armatimonadota bacterium]|nr:class I SAM-dependent methyltransferase [Armatimonadota bacterium]